MSLNITGKVKIETMPLSSFDCRLAFCGGSAGKLKGLKLLRFIVQFGVFKAFLPITTI